MKTLILLTFLFTAGFAGAANAQSKDWTPAQKEIWQMVETYSGYSRNRDLESYLSVFHPDFAGWHYGDASVTSKADRTEGLTWYFENFKAVEYRLEPLAIQALGNAAVVHYKIHQTLEDKDGNRSEDVSQWTDVLVKEKGRWLLVSDHGGGLSSWKSN